MDLAAIGPEEKGDVEILRIDAKMPHLGRSGVEWRRFNFGVEPS
jgi:hypothetical protein